MMPTTLTDAPTEPASDTLTEVLVETIISHAQILRLMAPDRYRQLLMDLPSAPAISPALSPEEYKIIWEDVEHHIAKFRERDKLAIEQEIETA
jgi:hypothetical protein